MHEQYQVQACHKGERAMTGRLIGLAMLIASAGAGAEVTDADAAGFGVLHERTVPLAPDAAYARFVDEVIDHYVHAARHEQSEYDRIVTDWDINRGFERA